MSKPKEIWWPYAKAVIRQYPQLRVEHNALYVQSVTADNSGMPRSGNASRTTEVIADRVIKGLPRQKQREFDAVRLAIQQTERHPTGKERMRLVRLVFWESRRVDDAALAIPCSSPTARRWHAEFIRLVAQNLDLTER